MVSAGEVLQNDTAEEIFDDKSRVGCDCCVLIISKAAISEIELLSFFGDHTFVDFVVIKQCVVGSCVILALLCA